MNGKNLMSMVSFLVFGMTALNGCVDDEQGAACSFGCSAPTGVAQGVTSAPEDSESEAKTEVESSDDVTGGESSSSSGGPLTCSLADNVCASDDVLRFCDEGSGQLLPVSCAEVCGSTRDSLGCDVGADGRASCYCGDERGTCDTDSSECVGDAAFRWCDDGVWDYVDCDTKCVADGYAGVAAIDGCSDLSESCADGPDCNNGGSLGVCNCVEAPCVQDAQYCAGPDTLKYCDGGVWQEFSCDEACGWGDQGDGIGCTFFVESGIETCACGG